MPLSLPWPSGGAIKLSYVNDTPEAQVKFHECFTLTIHPTLCEGRLPVTLSLHTPDGKRLGNTTDLTQVSGTRMAQASPSRCEEVSECAVAVESGFGFSRGAPKIRLKPQPLSVRHHRQPENAAELFYIVGDDPHAMHQRGGGDPHVVGSDQSSFACQCPIDLAILP